MFKVISQLDKNEQCQARTGKMLDAMETPCMILPTIGGSLPFLLPGMSSESMGMLSGSVSTNYEAWANHRSFLYSEGTECRGYQLCRHVRVE